MPPRSLAVTEPNGASSPRDRRGRGPRARGAVRSGYRRRDLYLLRLAGGGSGASAQVGGAGGCPTGDIGAVVRRAPCRRLRSGTVAGSNASDAGGGTGEQGLAVRTRAPVR